MKIVNWEYHTIYTLDNLYGALAYEREVSEISIKELSKLSKVSSKAIKAFEEGRRGLKIDAFLKIVNALDLDITIS